MKKLYLLPLLFILGSCTITLNNSNSVDENSTNEANSTVETVSNTDKESSIDEKSTVDDSTDESSSSNTGSGKIDVSFKEYYKSLVDRDNIHYSEKLVNDPNREVRQLEVWEINDTHGAFVDGEDITGITHVNRCINDNTSDPYACIKIANGDIMQGTAFSNMLLGEPAVAALNEMAFDAYVIGNHEFDWGIYNLAVYKDGNPDNGELDCPFLGANIVDKDGKRPDFIDPYTVVEKGDVKVGIIGIIGDGLESSISNVSLGDYSFSSSYDAVCKYSTILKDELHCDVIIVSVHDHNGFMNQRYVDDNKIDLIINGHDHQYVEEEVERYDGKNVLVLESNTKNISLGKATLYLDDNKEYNHYSVFHYKPSIYDTATNMDAIINEYYKVTSVYESTVIGHKAGGFSKEEIAITTMNYIAEKYDCDLSVTNTGGIRATIYESDITNGLIYEVFPFDNELYIAYLTGEEIKSAFNTGYYYNNTRIGLGRSLSLSDINYSKTYKVVCVDYVATKEYMTRFFNEEHGLVMTGDYIRDCALENIIANYND